MQNRHNNTIIISILLAFMIAYSIPQSIKIPTKESAISKAQLLGKIKASEQADFSIIEKPYTNKSNMYMKTQAYKAYKEMYADAAKEGIDLTIVSAFRSFYHQKAIWEAKWTGRRKVLGNDLSKKYPNTEARAKIILMFSSMPGTSRHHWGTDVDIYSVEDEDFQSGKGKKIYDWLVAHGNEFGFCQVYTPKPQTRSKGYEEEKWHWSYKPIAKQYLNSYKHIIKYSDITGFKGDRTAKKLKIIENYVLGINSNCKKSIKQQ